MNFKNNDIATNAFLFAGAVAVLGFVTLLGLTFAIPIAIIGGIGYYLYRKARRPTGTGTLYESTQRRVIRANFPATDEFMTAYMSRLLDAIIASGRPPAYSIFLRMIHTTEALYNEEEFSNPLPPIPPPNTIEEGRYRDKLLALQKKVHDAPRTLELFTTTIWHLYLEFIGHLPAIALTDLQTFREADEGAEPFSIPLIDAIPNLGHAVLAILSYFGKNELVERDLFKSIRVQIEENLDEIDPKKLASPLDYKGTSRDLVYDYLKGTPFLGFFDASIPFRIPEETRFSGQWIIAPPNRGKSVLLSNLVVQDIEKDASIILMDSKGDLIKPFKELASIKDRLVILEPSEDYPLAINPLDLGASTTHTVAFLEYVFSSLLESEPTPLQGTLFRSILIALKATPHATFADFRRILVDGYEPYAEYIKTLDSDDQDFFFKGEFASKTYEQTKQQLLWRIRDLTTRTPLLRNSFRAAKTKINIGQLMDQRKIIIIDTSKALLDDAGSEFLSRMFIAMVRAAADQRSRLNDRDKVPCYFYIDEAHTAISRDTKLAGILTECRSQKIAMVLAHQSTSQITNPLTLAALSDCAIRFANSDEEASQLAPRLRTTPDFLRSLPIGTFAAFVRDFTTGAVPLKIPFIDVTDLPKLTAEQRTSLRREMRERYAFAKQELAQPEPTAPEPSADIAQPPPSIDPLAAQKQ